MTLPLLTDGDEGNDRNELIQRINVLEQDLEDAHAATKRAREQNIAATRSLANLRKQLEPLHKALRMIFGELDAANIESSTDGPVSSPKVKGVWESWMNKLPGKPAEIIEALLEHGEMNVAQIRVAAHCGQQTVYDVTSKLNKLGLLNKNGGKYSLKQL